MIISPFNFPLALAAGMSAGVLVAGNTAVYKPSSDTPLSGLKLFEIYRDAGIPEGVFNLITGPGGNFQDVIFENTKISGLVFTGSSEVGLKIYNGFSRQAVRPCILEMGGKNPAIVTANADIDQAAEGVMKSAYGLGGQKCSALSVANFSMSSVLTAEARTSDLGEINFFACGVVLQWDQVKCNAYQDMKQM